MRFKELLIMFALVVLPAILISLLLVIVFAEDSLFELVTKIFFDLLT